MYGQRRGLAAPVQASDTDARNANFTLMHGKRRQQLEMQLEEKLELLKQYTNPRGIGMRGQTVPQNDVDLLQQQIAAIRQQLEGGQQSGALPPTPINPSAVSSAQSVGAAPSQRVTAHAVQAMSAGYPFPTAPTSTGSTGSRRDEVWQQKYEGWLRRNNGGRPQPVAAYGGSAYGGSAAPSVASSIAPSQPAWLPPVPSQPTPSVSSFAPTQQLQRDVQQHGYPQQRQQQQQQAYQQQDQNKYPQQGGYPQQQQNSSFQQPSGYTQQHGYPDQRQQQHGQQQHNQQQIQLQQQHNQQLQQQQSQQVQYGRRATPPHEPTNRNGPAVPYQQPQQQQQQAPLAGRRGQQSQRPW
jgi:hypothetical protein